MKLIHNEMDMSGPIKHDVVWPKAVKFDLSKPAMAGVVTMSAPDGAMCPREQTERGIAWLRVRGCSCKLADHYWGNAGFLAGTPEDVAADLHQMADDPEVDFILSAGGGYCSNALLTLLDFGKIAKASKPIVGLSNPTVLLNAITAKTGLVTYHGPVLVHNLGGEGGIDDATEKSFMAMLSGAPHGQEVSAEEGWEWLRHGTAAGRLLGGNLWSLEHLLGTPYEPDWAGEILMLEDCFCELHQVMASVMHFKAAGVFDKIGGLVLGVPLEVAETELPYSGTFNDVIMQAVKEYDFPVLANVHFGHTDRKITMPIGARMYLDSKADRIVFERN